MEPNWLSSARNLQRAPERTLEWTLERALYWTLERTLDWTLERTLGVVDPGAGLLALEAPPSAATRGPSPAAPGLVRVPRQPTPVAGAAWKAITPGASRGQTLRGPYPSARSGSAMFPPRPAPWM